MADLADLAAAVSAGRRVTTLSEERTQQLDDAALVMEGLQVRIGSGT